MRALGLAFVLIWVAATRAAAWTGTPVSDGGSTGTLVEGLPLTDSPNTCAADRNGNAYWDLSLYEPCVCNSSHSSGARWCQVDGGGCTSNASCG